MSEKELKKLGKNGNMASDHNTCILMKSHLTLSQTTNFRLFQTDRVCRRQFQI